MTEALSGIIPVFKPPGMTSKDVSRVLQRRFGKLKIGHVGTLDPDADGVLPVLLGAATKLQDYLLEMPKTYRFTVKLGTSTDTLDASGVETGSAAFDHVTRITLEQAAKNFVGQIRQIPPLYSAVKLNGKELYKHARSGTREISDEISEKLARIVTVYQINLIDFHQDLFEMSVACSKGTYVRTIADDLCRSLNTLGHVTFLRREVSAGFTLEQCIPLDQLTGDKVGLDTHLIPMGSVSIGLPIWQVNDSLLVRRIQDGQHINLPANEFFHGIVSESHRECVQKKVFLVRSGSGQNVGIGEIVSDVGSDQVLIHLKRGL